jgi:3-phenylpropionate/trans-cinnamate dioxygenase ferredoxin reductase component
MAVTDVKYLAIGGGLASARAAAAIRRVDAEGSILIATDETLPPYDRPPLSKEYLRGEKTTDTLLLLDRDALEQQRIDMTLGDAVVKLDASAKRAKLASGGEVGFEKALIATGARAIRLNVPGADLKGINYLRSETDARNIAANAQSGRRAVVVGGGFIGLEVAASLRQLGLDVWVIEAMSRIWARFANPQLSDYILHYCAEKGIRFLTDTTISEFRGSDHVEAVVTKDGTTIECDLACIGVGILPNTELASRAGLSVENGIMVDEYLRTSHPDIYAAGDVVNYFDTISNKRRRAEHWGHAEMSGMIAGQNMAGASQAYSFLSYVWSDIFDIHLEFAGDESEHDTVLLRGDLKSGSFMSIYAKDGCLTAFFAVNTPPREFAVVRRLIQTHKQIGGDEAQLQDPAFELRDLL